LLFFFLSAGRIFLLFFFRDRSRGRVFNRRRAFWCHGESDRDFFRVLIERYFDSQQEQSREGSVRGKVEKPSSKAFKRKADTVTADFLLAVGFLTVILIFNHPDIIK
jgi:hypothetical protein